MALPPSDFADAFRAHVVPRLRELAADGACAFVSGEMEYPEIIASVTAEGYRRGMGYLPLEHHDALLDWIHAAVTDAIDEQEVLAEQVEALVRSMLREPSRAVIRAAVRDFLGVE